MPRFRRDGDQSLLESNQYQNQSSYGSISENEEVSAMVATDALRRGRRFPQYIATIAATTGALAAGCVLGWSSPAESEIITKTAYGFLVTDEQFSWIGSLATVGGIFSCLMIGFVMDCLGRKNTMILLILPFMIGWALVIWPAGVISLYFGRFFVGFAGGAFFVVAPAYIGEIATKDVRGTLGSCMQLMITAGILFSYVVGEYLELKTFNVICAILPLIFGSIFLWMPESPYFYVMKNRIDKAEESLLWLRGEEYNYNDELIEIQIENELITRNRVSTWNAIRKPATQRGLIITMGCVFFVQFSGINAVIFYTGFIFNASGTDIGLSPTIIVGIMQVVATFVAAMTVDNLGRRFLLIGSALVMCVCNIGLGVYFTMLEHGSEYLNVLNWLPITSCCVYIIAFSLGLGPVPWVLCGELFTQEVKAIGSSLTGSTSWIVAFIVTKCFSNVRDLIGIGSTFFIFAIFAAMCTVFVLLVVPETKGKSFNEIQRALVGNNIHEGAEIDDNQTTVTSTSQTTSQNTIAI